jgi:predicted phosphodiesterase
MRLAIISDIHGNWEALQAVAADIDAWNADAVLCLGDTIGYGPNPAECLDWIRNHASSLLGNAEEAALFDPDAGGEANSPMMAWTRAALGIAANLSMDPSVDNAHNRPASLVLNRSQVESLPERTVGGERRRYLETLPRVVWRNHALLVHASPRNPLHEYLLPGVLDHAATFDTLFRLFHRWAFVGHTHIAGVFTEDRRFAAAVTVPEFTLGGRRALINAGSVGQPRDGDTRASYVRWEDDRVVFRRVAYDLAGFLAKIRLHPALASPQTERWFSAAT